MRNDRRPVLGCDLDGVIGDIVQQIVRFSRREHRISMTKKHIVSEDIETCAPIRREQLHELFKNREFFRSLPMVPHAREALLQLKTAGCEIHVVTDRFWYAGIQEDTKEWLTQRRIPFDSLVFARKSAKHDVADHLGIEWFIEDQLSNARLLAPLCQVLLVNRPYNQGGIPDHVTRVEDLRRAVTVILGAMKVSESNGQPQRMALRCPA